MNVRSVQKKEQQHLMKDAVPAGLLDYISTDQGALYLIESSLVRTKGAIKCSKSRRYFHYNIVVGCC